MPAHPKASFAQLDARHRPEPDAVEIFMAAMRSMVPTGEFAAITPHDTTELKPPARSIYVGGAGDVVVKNTDGTAITFKAVPVGSILPINCAIVMSTGTTATDLVAL